MKFNRDKCQALQIPRNFLHYRGKTAPATTLSGDGEAMKQLCGKGPGVEGGQQDEREPTVCAGSKGNQQPSGLYEQWHSLSIKGVP